MYSYPENGISNYAIKSTLPQHFIGFCRKRWGGGGLKSKSVGSQRGFILALANNPSFPRPIAAAAAPKEPRDRSSQQEIPGGKRRDWDRPSAAQDWRIYQLAVIISPQKYSAKILISYKITKVRASLGQLFHLEVSSRNPFPSHMTRRQRRGRRRTRTFGTKLGGKKRGGKLWWGGIHHCPCQRRRLLETHRRRVWKLSFLPGCGSQTSPS